MGRSFRDGIRDALGLDEQDFKNMGRYVFVFLGFVLVYALFLPLIPLVEPNPYPAVGNGVFYSTSKMMEFVYFAGSFILFCLLVFILYKKKIIRFDKERKAEGGIGGKERKQSRKVSGQNASGPNVWRTIAVFILPIILFLILFANHEAQPRAWHPDWFHEGEVTVHQDKPFFDAYKDYYPFKNVLFSRIFSFLGVGQLIRGYFPLAVMVSLTNIILYFLFLFIYRLIKGTYSIVPGVIFMTLWLLDFTLELNDRLFFFLLFLSFLVLYLIYSKKWLFVLGVLALSGQCLVSAEFAAFGILGLLVFILVRAKSTKDFLVHALLSAVAFLPLVILFLAHGQLGSYAGFVLYQSKTHISNGAPILWPSQTPYPDEYSPWHGFSLHGLAASFNVLRFLFVWLFLLFVAGLLVHDVFVRKRRDATAVWLVTITAISIIIFKTGFGQESHLFIPAKFVLIAAFSYYFARRFDFCLPSLARRFPVIIAVLVILVVFAPTLVRYAHGNAPYGVLLEKANVKTPMVYDGHYKAFVPVADRDRTARIETLAEGKSIFFFSDEPYFNRVLKKQYLLKDPLLFDINTEAMLIEETGRLKAWSPDLIVWKSGYKSNGWMGIRNPARYYVMAGWILENYTPYARVDDFYVFERKGANYPLPPVENISRITIDDVYETFHLMDFPYNVGRAEGHGVDFSFVTFTAKRDALCTYYIGSFPAFDFNAYKGEHRYAFYPQASPLYVSSKGEKTRIKCG